MRYHYEKIAKILRTDKDVIRLTEEKLAAATGRKHVIEKIAEENNVLIENRLGRLGLPLDSGAKRIFDALIEKIKSDDENLRRGLGNVPIDTPEGCAEILNCAKKIAGEPTGFFLKKEKAVEFLKLKPPFKVIEALGYKDIAEALKKEDLFEIFSALRFLEDKDWLNDIFFRQYENLKPDDFEERPIVMRPLGPKWTNAARNFVKKKYHNISHLKEMGVIFIIPGSLGVAGETIRNFSLILHYLNEIPFYSNMFRHLSKNVDTFGREIISLLRGDVVTEKLPQSKTKSRWLVIQRYLAKQDENDWRLFEPHINPEAMHWERAEQLLIKSGEIFDGFSEELSFWRDLNWVGDYFGTDTGVDVLVSFNLVDTAMALVQQRELIKYLYHHQESLWNKIFSEYFGEGRMEELMTENILRGWFEI